ncbi:MAG TPA: PP2C family protein-serine/threonine phosphatase [Vicinamibacterales bacterium]|jgi:serine phosphatase RsbU (regulator of sigma subunit)
MYRSDMGDLLEHLTDELNNFQDIAKYLVPQPGELPNIAGVEVFGGTLALNGSVGGDHIIYVDFKQRYDLQVRIASAIDQDKPELVENLRRCEKMAGIVVIDVAGHQVTDALLAAMMHQAFLLGSIYELDMFGQITERLFENLNTRFYKSSGERKFISMVYGEISEDAMFRFISAAQPPPAVFSRRYDRFMEVGQDLCVSFPPIGLLPSLHVTDRHTTNSVLGFKDQYQLNEWMLMGEGDILLLHTDGLSEHVTRTGPYFPGCLERTLTEVKERSAMEIFEAIKQDVLALGRPRDDISVVVIKRK